LVPITQPAAEERGPSKETDSDDAVQLLHAQNGDLQLNENQLPKPTEVANVLDVELLYYKEDLEDCLVRMRNEPALIAWTNHDNNYMLFLQDQISSLTDPADREHFRLIQAAVCNTAEIMKSAGFDIQNPQMLLIISGEKPKRCTVCYQRFKRQVRCQGTRCLTKRVYTGYRFLECNGLNYCLLCPKKFQEPAEIALHYLSHNARDVMFLGLSPMTLRTVFQENVVQPNQTDIQTATALNDQLVGRFSSHRYSYTGSSGSSRYEESKGPSRRL